LKAEWPNLQALSLFYTKVNKIELWGCNRWPSLLELHLSNINLNDEGAAAIAKSNWPVLSHLDLSFNYIRSAGASALGKGRWPIL
jgi:hypothetical protein